MHKYIHILYTVYTHLHKEYFVLMYHNNKVLTILNRVITWHKINCMYFMMEAVGRGELRVHYSDIQG